MKGSQTNNEHQLLADFNEVGHQLFSPIPRRVSRTALIKHIYSNFLKINSVECTLCRLHPAPSRERKEEEILKEKCERKPGISCKVAQNIQGNALFSKVFML